MKLRQSASSLYEQIRTHHSKPLNERNKRGPQLALRALEKEYGDVVKKSVYKTEVLARAYLDATTRTTTTTMTGKVTKSTCDAMRCDAMR